MINKRNQWGLYRIKAKPGFAPTNLLGTFVGLGSMLYATREQASRRIVEQEVSFQLEVRKFNPRKNKS